MGVTVPIRCTNISENIWNDKKVENHSTRSKKLKIKMKIPYDGFGLINKS